MDNQIEEHVKEERLAILQKQVTMQQIRHGNEMVGRVVPVLFEKKGKLQNQLVGKTPYMQSIHVVCNNKIGDIVDVKIVSAGPNSLEGEI